MGVLFNFFSPYNYAFTFLDMESNLLPKTLYPSQFFYYFGSNFVLKFFTKAIFFLIFLFYISTYYFQLSSIFKLLYPNFCFIFRLLHLFLYVFFLYQFFFYLFLIFILSQFFLCLFGCY